MFGASCLVQLIASLWSLLRFAPKLQSLFLPFCSVHQKIIITPKMLFQSKPLLGLTLMHLHAGLPLTVGEDRLFARVQQSIFPR